jgi:hypothetical protein
MIRSAASAGSWLYEEPAPAGVCSKAIEISGGLTNARLIEGNISGEVAG